MLEDKKKNSATKSSSTPKLNAKKGGDQGISLVHLAQNDYC